VYLGHDTESYLLAGGLDSTLGTTSNLCFLLKDGAINEVMEMYAARQNHSLIQVRISKSSTDPE